MRALGTLIATAAVTAGLLTAGGVASAASTPDALRLLRSNDCVELRGAIGCFYSDGDHVVVHDDKADGRRPEVVWETDYGRYGTCRWKGTSYWTDCNYNLRESGQISFRVLQRSVRTGEIVDASGWGGGSVGG